MKSRFLGGISFLPLFAPEGVSGSDPALEAEPQKDDFAAALEAEADKNPADQNDPNDLNHSEADELAAEAKAEEPAKEEPEAEPEKDEPEEVEQLRKTVKALGKRVSTLSREKRDLHAKLQENIKPVRNEEPAEEDGEQPQRSDFKTKAEFDVAVQAEAERRLAVQEFNSKCNTVEAAGAKEFGAEKWAKAKQDLAMLDDQGRIPLDILSVALETDDPARVLFVLGNDIDKATELMGMTPIKRAIAMDKIAGSKPAAAPRQQSKTPPPVDPIGARGSADERPRDSDSDEEWNRKEEIRERKVREEKRRRLGLA